MSQAAEVATAAALRFRVPATRTSASVLRAELAAWLRELGAAGDNVFDLQVACSEALAIIVDRPSPRVALVVEIEGALTADGITVVLREFGLCRESDSAPKGVDHALSVSLIEAMTDSFAVYDHPDGRAFVLNRKLRGKLAPVRVKALPRAGTARDGGGSVRSGPFLLDRSRLA